MPRHLLLFLCGTGTSHFLQRKIAAPPAVNEIIVTFIFFYFLF